MNQNIFLSSLFLSAGLLFSIPSLGALTCDESFKDNSIALNDSFKKLDNFTLMNFPEISRKISPGTYVNSKVIQEVIGSLTPLELRLVNSRATLLENLIQTTFDMRFLLPEMHGNISKNYTNQKDMLMGQIGKLSPAQVKTSLDRLHAFELITAGGLGESRQEKVLALEEVQNQLKGVETLTDWEISKAIGRLSVKDLARTLDKLSKPKQRPKIEDLNKFLRQTDLSSGEGLRYAKVFSPYKKTPIHEGQELTNDILSSRKQEVLFQGTNLGLKARGATVVEGVPTHIFINPKTGEIAYMGFQGQPVSLHEYIFHMNDGSRVPIKGQGVDQHTSGFSMPVGSVRSILTSEGKIAVLNESLTQLTTTQLKAIMPIGSSVQIEYQSGVVVEGKVKSYTQNSYHAGDYSTVITFENKTARVTYGVHDLFKPEWGEYDLLLAPSMFESNSTAPSDK